MEASELKELFLRTHGLQLEPEMCAYVARRIRDSSGQDSHVPVMGGDARTGVAVRRVIPVSAIVSDPRRSVSSTEGTLFP